LVGVVFVVVLAGSVVFVVLADCVTVVVVFAALAFYYLQEMKATSDWGKALPPEGEPAPPPWMPIQVNTSFSLLDRVGRPHSWHSSVRPLPLSVF